jgi:hypothetical protein
MAYKDVRASDVPAWGGLVELNRRFEALRDRRFLEMPSRPGFSRRISWMYPDDGCYARGAMARMTLASWGLELPAKMFIFGYGGLKVETAHHPKGFVEWWYHVAPAVSVEGRIYVLDPSIEPGRPLLLEEWALRQNRDLERLKISVCGPYAYSPSSSCLASTSVDEKDALQDQRLILGWEWNRQEFLGRDPQRVLGDEPPWKPVAAL